MSVLGWIVVGLIAGAIGGRITGMKGQGCLATMVIGVIGGLLGGAMFSAAGDEGIDGFGIRSIFVALVGATVLLFVAQVITGNRRR